MQVDSKEGKLFLIKSINLCEGNQPANLLLNGLYICFDSFYRIFWSVLSTMRVLYNARKVNHRAKRAKNSRIIIRKDAPRRKKYGHARRTYFASLYLHWVQ